MSATSALPLNGGLDQQHYSGKLKDNGHFLVPPPPPLLAVNGCFNMISDDVTANCCDNQVLSGILNNGVGKGLLRSSPHKNNIQDKAVSAVTQHQDGKRRKMDFVLDSRF